MRMLITSPYFLLQPAAKKLCLVIVATSICISCSVTSVFAGCNFNPICNPIFFVCCTLDREGNAPSYCQFECPIETVLFDSYQSTAQKNVSTYAFTGQSSYTASGPSVACPPGVKKVKGVGTWEGEKQGLGGVAKEEVLWEQQFVTGGWTTLITTTNKCNVNPWLSENATCTLITKDPANSKFPEPFPRTARILTETMRQSLLFYELTKVPPVIQSPQNGYTATDGVVAFTAHKFTPDSSAVGIVKIEAVFERVVWPGDPEYKKITEVTNITNGTVLKVVTLESGSWSIKARVISDLGPGLWSSKINIIVPKQKIKSLKKKEKLKLRPVKLKGIIKAPE